MKTLFEKTISNYINTQKTGISIQPRSSLLFRLNTCTLTGFKKRTICNPSLFLWFAVITGATDGIGKAYAQEVILR